MTIRESVIDMDFTLDEIIVISTIPYEITELADDSFYAASQFKIGNISAEGMWVSHHNTEVIRITKESEIIMNLLNDI